MDTRVSITKVENSIEAAVKKSISLVGGMDSVVNRGDEIYLKPNFVAPRNSSTGVTTNFEIIRVVAEEIRRCGGVPILFETPATEFDRDTVYDVLGVHSFANKNGIKIVNAPLDIIKVPVTKGNVFRALKIPQCLHKAKILNLPKLKTHVSAKMTCGMKNLIGLLPDSEKRRVHICGVHKSIADICNILKPILTVVDATTCMQGDGPTYGDKVNLNLIISGKDPLATDKVCSQIIALPWDQIEYIRLEDAKYDRHDVEVVGESLENIAVPFKIPYKTIFYHFSTRMIHILDVVFSVIFRQHLNHFLFNTGYFGTIPKINKDNCNACGDCINICPIENTIDIGTLKIDYKKCIRCLDCFFACDKQAITVKGFSRPESHRSTKIS
jgi:uncharacterized protein (DUF362 family)/ferredoxin-like protein FixX